MEKACHHEFTTEARKALEIRSFQFSVGIIKERINSTSRTQTEKDGKTVERGTNAGAEALLWRTIYSRDGNIYARISARLAECTMYRKKGLGEAGEANRTSKPQ